MDFKEFLQALTNAIISNSGNYQLKVMAESILYFAEKPEFETLAEFVNLVGIPAYNTVCFLILHDMTDELYDMLHINDGREYPDSIGDLYRIFSEKNIDEANFPMALFKGALPRISKKFDNEILF